MSKKLEWQDLPEPLSAFTARNAEMVDMDNNKVVQYYSANTKIKVVQKCVTPDATYYRTESAKKIGLNWAFKAAAFGLPNDIAPPVHSFSPGIHSKPAARIPKPAAKQTPVQKRQAPKGGVGARKKPFWAWLLRRKNV